MGEGGYRQINKSLNVCAFEDYLSTQQSVLPKLDDVEQLTPLVLRVLGQNAGKVNAPFFSIEAYLLSHSRCSSSHFKVPTRTSLGRGP